MFSLTNSESFSQMCITVELTMLPGLPLRRNPVLNKTIPSGLFTRTIFKGIFKLAHFPTSIMTFLQAAVCGGGVIGSSS